MKNSVVSREGGAHPVITGAGNLTDPSRRTGSSAFADDDTEREYSSEDKTHDRAPQAR